MAATLLFTLFISLGLLALVGIKKFLPARMQAVYYPFCFGLYLGSVVCFAFLCRTAKTVMQFRWEPLKIYRWAWHCLRNNGEIGQDTCNAILKMRQNVFDISQGAPLQDMLLNIVFFMPFGFLVPLVWRRCSFLKTLAAGGVLSLLIEGGQALTRLGVCDVDDVLNNLFGTALGYLLFRLARRLLALRRVVQKS